MSDAYRRPVAWSCLAVVSIAIGLFAVAAWGSSRHLDTLWDERVDLDIALALRHAPIGGEAQPLDASQMRLPMYACAATFAVVGHDGLPTARAVSVAAGALTIALTATLAWWLFGPPTAALAALLLAFSPYFLAYARIAMTEGDIFLALTVVAACLAFHAYTERPGGLRWLLVGVTLGLAVGAKAYAGLLFLVFAIALRASSRAVIDTTSASNTMPSESRSSTRRASTLLFAAGALIAASLVAGQLGCNSPAVLRALPFVWGAVLVLWVALVATARRVDPTRWGWHRVLATWVVIAAATWIALMPEHLTQPRILRELLARLLRWDNRIPLALWSDHLRLYSGILLLKMTPLVGVLSVAALLHAGIVEGRDRRWRDAILTIVFWIIAMCFLPLRQTFYLVGIYPLIALVTAAFMLHVVDRLGRGVAVRRIAAALVFIAMPVGWLALRSKAAYPDFELFPDDEVRTSWLGAEPRGYRNLIQTNSDGVEALIRWCGEHVPAGARVVSYLWEDSIIAHALPADHRFRFVPRGLSERTAVLPPPPPIDDADYVLLHVNNILGYGDLPPDTPPMAELQRDFTPVFTVRRGRGPTELAWVYQRLRPSNKAAPSRPAIQP